jgi:preprotein translocase subunit SecD
MANILQSLRSVNTTTLGMDLSNGFRVTAEVNCNTERDAKFVHDLLKGVIGLGRLNTPDNQPQMLRLYDAIEVTQQQTRTQVKADIPQELADKFLDLWLKR